MYIDNNRDKYSHIYILSKNAYYVKLNVKYTLDKFDLINNGNMGYNGSNTYIEEIGEYCQKNSCMFILYKYEFSGGESQTDKHILEFVKNNYEFKEEVHLFNIYSN